jgi:hypothetical protein
MSLITRRAAVAAAATAIGLALSACGGSSGSPPASPDGTGAASSPGGTLQTSTAGPPTSTATTGSVADYTLDTGYAPVFPFTTATQAQAWVASYHSGGHQPWHLDAGLTALAFTQGYLGYTGISRTGAGHVDDQGMHLEVGYTQPDGTFATSAVVHLVRFGTGPDAPWEVVGTDDTTFSVENPVYDTTASSPAQVGGHITGVDENIRVQVRRLSRQSPVGTFCCQAAGGNNSPWSVTVAFKAPSGAVITIAVAIGGHVAPVERFAITGVTVG